MLSVKKTFLNLSVSPRVARLEVPCHQRHSVRVHMGVSSSQAEAASPPNVSGGSERHGGDLTEVLCTEGTGKDVGTL